MSNTKAIRNTKRYSDYLMRAGYFPSSGSYRAERYSYSSDTGEEEIVIPHKETRRSSLDWHDDYSPGSTVTLRLGAPVSRSGPESSVEDHGLREEQMNFTQPEPYTDEDRRFFKTKDSIDGVLIGNKIGKPIRDSIISNHLDSVFGTDDIDSLQAKRNIYPEEYLGLLQQRSAAIRTNLFDFLEAADEDKFSGPINDLISGSAFKSDAIVPFTARESSKIRIKESIQKEYDEKYNNPNNVISDYIKAIAAAEYAAKYNATILSLGLEDEVELKEISATGEVYISKHSRSNNDIASLFTANIDIEDAFYKYLKDPSANVDGNEDASDKWIPNVLVEMAKEYTARTGRRVDDNTIRNFSVNNPAGRAFLQADKHRREFFKDELENIRKKFSVETDKNLKGITDFYDGATRNIQKYTPYGSVVPVSMAIYAQEGFGAYGVLKRIDDAIEVLNRTRTGESNVAKTASAFGRGAVQDAGDLAISAGTFGVSEMLREGKTINAMKKVINRVEQHGSEYVDANFEKLFTKEEMLIFETFKFATAVDQYMKDDVIMAYGAGRSLAEGLSYTIEFRLGAGFAKIGTKATLSAVSKIFAKRAEKFLAKGYIKALSRAGTETGVRAASASGARAATGIMGANKFSRFAGSQLGKIGYFAYGSAPRALLSPRSYVNAYLESVNTSNYAAHVGNDHGMTAGLSEAETSSVISNLPSSWYNSFIDAFTEQFSFSRAIVSGAGLPIVGTKMATNILNSKWYNKYDEFMSWTKRSFIGRQVDGIWNGFLIEPMEEVEASLFKGELNADFFSERNLVNLFSGTLGVGILLGLPGSVNMLRYNNNVRKQNHLDYNYFKSIGIEKETIDGLIDIIDTQRQYFKLATLDYFSKSVLNNIKDNKVKAEAFERLAKLTIRNTVSSTMSKAMNPDSKEVKTAIDAFIKRTSGTKIMDDISAMSTYDNFGNPVVVNLDSKDDSGNVHRTNLLDIVFDEQGAPISAKIKNKDGSLNDIDLSSIEGELTMTPVKEYYKQSIDAIAGNFLSNIDKIANDFNVKRANSLNKKNKVMSALNEAIKKERERRIIAEETGKTSKIKPSKGAKISANRSGPSSINFKISDTVDDKDVNNMSDDDLKSLFDGIDDLESIDLSSVEVERVNLTEEEINKNRIRDRFIDDEFFESLTKEEQDKYIHDVYVDEVLKDEQEDSIPKGSSIFTFDIGVAAAAVVPTKKLRYTSDRFFPEDYNKVESIPARVGSIEDNAPKFVKGVKIARTLFVQLGYNTQDLLEDGALEGADVSIHVDKIDGVYEIGVNIVLKTGKIFKAQIATPEKVAELYNKRIIDRIERSLYNSLRNYIIDAFESNTPIGMVVEVGTPKMSVNYSKYKKNILTPISRVSDLWPDKTNSRYFDAITLMYNGDFYEYNNETGMFQRAEFLNHVGSRTGISVRLNAPIIKDKKRFTKIYGPTIGRTMASILYNAIKMPTARIGDIITRIIDAGGGIGTDTGSESSFIHIMQWSNMTAAEFLSVFLNPDITDRFSLSFRDSHLFYGSESVDIDSLTPEGFLSFVENRNLSINPEFLFNYASVRSAHALKLDTAKAGDRFHDYIDLNSEFISLYMLYFGNTVLKHTVFEPSYLYLVPEISGRAKSSTDDISDAAVAEAREEALLFGNEFKIGDTEEQTTEKATSAASEEFVAKGRFKISRYIRILANRMIMRGVSSLISDVFKIKVVSDAAEFNKRVDELIESGDDMIKKAKEAEALTGIKKLHAFIEYDSDGNPTMYLSLDTLSLKMHELAHFLVSLIERSGLMPQFRESLRHYSNTLTTGQKYSLYKKEKIDEEIFCDKLSEMMVSAANDVSLARLIGMIAKSAIESILPSSKRINASAYTIFASNIINASLMDLPFIQYIMESQKLALATKKSIIGSLAAGNKIRENKNTKTGDGIILSDYDEDMYNKLKALYPGEEEDVLRIMSNTYISNGNYVQNDNLDTAVYSVVLVNPDGTLVLSEDNKNEGTRAVIIDEVTGKKINYDIIHLGDFSSPLDAHFAVSGLNPASMVEKTMIKYSVKGKNYVVVSNNDLVVTASASNYLCNRFSESFNDSQLDIIAKMMARAGASNNTILAITGRTVFSGGKRKITVSRPQHLYRKVNTSAVMELINKWPNSPDVKLSDLYGGDNSGIYDAIKDFNVSIAVSDTRMYPDFFIYGNTVNVIMPAAATKKDIVNLFSTIPHMATSSYTTNMRITGDSPSQFVYLSRSNNKNKNLTKELSDKFDASVKLFNSLYRSNMTQEQVQQIRSSVLNKTGWNMINGTTGIYSSSVISGRLHEYMSGIYRLAKKNRSVKISFTDLFSSVPALKDSLSVDFGGNLKNTTINFIYDTSKKNRGKFIIDKNQIKVYVSPDVVSSSLTLLHEINHAVNFSSYFLTPSPGGSSVAKLITMNSEAAHKEMIDILRNPSVSIFDKMELVAITGRLLNLRPNKLNGVFSDIADFIEETMNILNKYTAEELRSMVDSSTPEESLQSQAIMDLINKHIDKSRFFSEGKAEYFYALMSGIVQPSRSTANVKNKNLLDSYFNKAIESIAYILNRPDAARTDNTIDSVIAIMNYNFLAEQTGIDPSIIDPKFTNEIIAEIEEFAAKRKRKINYKISDTTEDDPDADKKDAEDLYDEDDYHDDYSDEDYIGTELDEEAELIEINIADFSEIVDAEISRMAIEVNKIGDLKDRVEEFIVRLSKKYKLIGEGLRVKSYVNNRYSALVKAAGRSVTGYKDIFNFIPFSGLDGTYKLLSKKVLRSMMREAAARSKNYDEFVRYIYDQSLTNFVYSAVVEFSSAAKKLGILNFYQRLYSAYKKERAEYTDSAGYNVTEEKRDVINRQLLESIKIRLTNMKIAKVDESGAVIKKKTGEVVSATTGKVTDTAEVVSVNIYSDIKKKLIENRDFIVTVYNKRHDFNAVLRLCEDNDPKFLSNYRAYGWSNTEFINRYISFKISGVINFLCDMVGTSFTEDAIMLAIYGPLSNDVKDSDSIYEFITSIAEGLDPYYSKNINEYSVVGRTILALELINNRTQDTTVRSIDGESHSGIINKNGFSHAVDLIAAMSDSEYEDFIASNPYKSNSRLLAAIRTNGAKVLTNLKLSQGDDLESNLVTSDLIHLALGYIPLGKISTIGARRYIRADGVIPSMVYSDNRVLVEDLDIFLSNMSEKFKGYALAEIDSIINNINIYNSRRSSPDYMSKLVEGYHINPETGGHGLGCYFSEYMSGVSVKLDGVAGASLNDESFNNVPLAEAINKVKLASSSSMLDAAILVRKRILEHGVSLNGLKIEMLQTTLTEMNRHPDSIAWLLLEGLKIRKKIGNYTSEELKLLSAEAAVAGFRDVYEYIEYLEKENDESAGVNSDSTYDENQDFDDMFIEGNAHFELHNDKDPLDMVSKIMKSSGDVDLKVLSDQKYINFITQLFLSKRVSEIETSKAIYGNPNEFGGVASLEKRSQSFNTSYTLMAEYAENSQEFSGNTFRMIDVDDIYTMDPSFLDGEEIDPSGETLGAVLISPYLFREIMQRGRGWSTDMEIAFNDTMSLDASNREKMMRLNNDFGSLKLIYCGDLNFNGQSITRIVKAQFFTMFYNLDPETEKYFNMLVDPDPKKRIHAIGFKDSIKSGFANGAINRLPFNRLGMVSIPVRHGERTISLLRRLITYGDDSIVSSVNSIMAKNRESLAREIIRENGSINIEYLINKVKNMNKPVELSALLYLSKIVKSMPDFNVFNVCGVPSLLFDTITAVVRDAFDIKISGNAYTSMPGIFASKSRLMYINEDNKAEIIVPISLYSSVIGNLNYKDAVEKLTDLGYIGSASNVVIIRNPVQSEGSLSNAAIVGVIPDIYGETVAVPAGFNVASGGDNDGDKVFVYTSSIKNDPDVNILIKRSIKDKTQENIKKTDKDLKAYVNADKATPSVQMPRFVSQYISEASGLGLVGIAVVLNTGHQILLKNSSVVSERKKGKFFVFSNAESEKEFLDNVSSSKSGLMSLTVDAAKYPVLQNNNINPLLFNVLFAYASISGDTDMVMRLMKTDLYELGIPKVPRWSVDVGYLSKSKSDALVVQMKLLYDQIMSGIVTIPENVANAIREDAAIFINTMAALSSLYSLAKKSYDFADTIRDDKATFSSIMRTAINVEKKITTNPLSVPNLKEGFGLLGLNESHNSMKSFLHVFSGHSLAMNPSFIRATLRIDIRMEQFADIFNGIGVLRGISYADIAKTAYSVAQKYNITFKREKVNANEKLIPNSEFRLFKRPITVQYIHSVNLSNKTIMRLVSENPNDQDLADFCRLYIASCSISPLIRTINKVNFFKKSQDPEPESGQSEMGNKIESSNEVSFKKLPAPGTTLPPYYSILFDVFPSYENELSIDDTTIANSKYDAEASAAAIRRNFNFVNIKTDELGGRSTVITSTGIIGKNISRDEASYVFKGELSDKKINVLKNFIFSIENNVGVVSLQIKPSTVSDIVSSMGIEDITVIGSSDFNSSFYRIDDYKMFNDFDPNYDYESKLIIVDPAVLSKRNILLFQNYAVKHNTNILFVVNDLSNAPSSMYSDFYEETRSIYNESVRPEDVERIIADNSNRTIISVNKNTAKAIEKVNKSVLKEIFIKNPKNGVFMKTTAVQRDSNGNFIVKYSGSEKLVDIGASLDTRRYLRLNEAANSPRSSVLVFITRGYEVSKVLSRLSFIKEINDIKIVEINSKNPKYIGLSDDDKGSKTCAI